MAFFFVCEAHRTDAVAAARPAELQVGRLLGSGRRRRPQRRRVQSGAGVDVGRRHRSRSIEDVARGT